jgi:hypothetical protein
MHGHVACYRPDHESSISRDSRADRRSVLDGIERRCHGTNHEIFVMKTDGTEATRLTTDAAYENWWPRISPDRTKVLFYRAPAGNPENYGEASLVAVNVSRRFTTSPRASIAPGSSVTRTVRLTPATVGDLQEAIGFPLGAGENLMVQLDARIVDHQLALSRSQVAFAEALRGDSARQTIAITNAAATPITVPIVVTGTRLRSSVKLRSHSLRGHRPISPSSSSPRPWAATAVRSSRGPQAIAITSWFP